MSSGRGSPPLLQTAYSNSRAGAWGAPEALGRNIHLSKELKPRREATWAIEALQRGEGEAGGTSVGHCLTIMLSWGDKGGHKAA